MSAGEYLSDDWSVGESDELRRRLRRLGWSQADPELRARCWDDFKRLMAARAEAADGGAPSRDDHVRGASDTYSCTRRTVPGRVATAQAWYGVNSPSVVLGHALAVAR